MSLPGRREESAGARRSRLRLIVLQALVFSLFATLVGRLYYLQVSSGEAYRAQAASQSVRDVVIQPQRGLIVDDQGRPLVANRMAWVVSIDRTTLGRLGESAAAAQLARLSRIVGASTASLRARLLDCGTPDAKAGRCWNGSPYQPVPVAEDVPQAVALRLLEQPEDFPEVVVDQQSVRDYPRPYGVNLAHVLGYLSPVTEDELATATKDRDQSLNGASSVGRAGLERQYDTWLRGMPGYQQVAVDSLGRVLGDDGRVAARPGDTLVTSIDARVQATVERQLHEAMLTARKTVDKVTGRPYVADSGAAVVLEARTGRVVAMASQPTYDPSVWVGGISQRRLDRLYAADSGDPLLSRAFQGQFAPGSTWKPMMSVGALLNGYSTSSRLDCSSNLTVGSRVFKNYESASYGPIGFDRALAISCDTFYYRIGLGYWNRYGSDPTDVDAKDPLVEEAKRFGFGRATGVDLPGEAAGRIADRRWKQAYYESMKDTYCRMDRKGTAPNAFLKVFAHEFCLEGNYYRAGDAVNFSIGQGDTLVTPLQLARAYGALVNGGTLFEPTVGKAVVGADGRRIESIEPKVAARLGDTARARAALRYVDHALLGTTREGTLAWRFGGFPLDRVRVRSKTGTAEVYGKQTTSWVASYDDDYVVVMMISQAGTGSGASGPAVRKIWEALYGVDGETVRPSRAAIPGTTPPAGLPTFTRDGAILPPRREE
ncbi:penicillin-binding protein 2 [Nocardioides sp. TRM66260-LWL]|uniref:penicillin-binding protein 2 n=1 Tax=Nocardioides sp. TRM66260-LWL TaxID=2874478 RepID=UPI001CC82EDE|nr:penicillin-binding protein 2 [Nocardioides sp. TRM66260-LWL]MBZ5733041.1 penicillin-binding protein 2 [Nocardioides sp. TRM66260-LWL]